MSDGMSDARAESGLARNVWETAFDLADMIARLDQAIKQARGGHRGWGIARGWILHEINRALRHTGFILVDHHPDKSFECYPDAYEHRPTWREKKLEAELAALRGDQT